MRADRTTPSSWPATTRSRQRGGGDAVAGKTGATGDTVTLNGQNENAYWLNSSTLNVNGSSDGASIYDGNTLTAGSSSANLILSVGNGDIITDAGSGNTLRIGSNATVTATGTGSFTAALTGATGDSVTLNGQNEGAYGLIGSTLNVNGSNDTASILNANTVTEDGSSNTVWIGSNSTVTATGIGDIVSTNSGATGDAVTLNGQNEGVYALNNSTLTVNGANDGGIIADNNTVNASASSSNLNLQAGLSDTVTVAGTNENVWVGSNSTVVATGIGDIVSANSGATGDAVTLSGLNEGVYALNNSTLTVNGTNDGGIISNGNTVNASASSSNLNLNTGTSDTVTEAGTNDTVYIGSNNTVISTGIGDIVSTTSGAMGDAVTLNGLNEGVYGLNNSTLAVNGTNDGGTISNGNTVNASVSSSNLNLTVSSGNTVNGQAGDTIGVIGSNDVINGSSLAVNFKSGTQNSVAGSNDAIVLLASVGATVTGNSNTIYGSSSDTIAVGGQGDAVVLSGSGNVVTGTGLQIGLNANYAGLTVQGAGNVITTGGTNNNIAGSGEQIVLNASYAGIGVQGNNNLVTAGGSYDAVYLSGADNAANISNGTVNLVGNNNSALVDGYNNQIYGAGSGNVIGLAGANLNAPDYGLLASDATVVEPAGVANPIYSFQFWYPANDGSGDYIANTTVTAGNTGAIPPTISAAILNLTPDIDAVWNTELGRDPTSVELVSAQLGLASGQTLDQLAVSLANSPEAQADMANIYAAVLPSAPIFDRGAPTASEVAGFADAMSIDFGQSITLFNPVTGAVLADTDATSLLTELPVLETLANGRTLSLAMADGTVVQFADTGRLATFLYGLDVDQGAATGEVTSIYNQDIAWLNQIGQPLLETAQHYSDAANYAYSQIQALVAQYGQTTANLLSGTLTQQAQIAQTASAMALEMAAQGPGRQPYMVTTLQLGSHIGQVSVGFDGSASEHDLSQNPLATVANFAAMLVNALAVAFPNPGTIALAAAVDVAEAGEAFANGDIVGGLLKVAQAVGLELPGLGAAELASEINVVTRVVGGVYGAVQAAQNGDGAGIAAGLLEAAAGVASGIGAGLTDPGAQKLLNDVASALGTASQGITMGQAFASGDIAAGLQATMSEMLSALGGDNQQEVTAEETIGQAAITGNAILAVSAEQEIDALPTYGAAFQQAVANVLSPESAVAGGSATLAEQYSFSVNMAALGAEAAAAEAGGNPNFTGAVSQLSGSAVSGTAGGPSEIVSIDGKSWRIGLSAETTQDGKNTGVIDIVAQQVDTSTSEGVDNAIKPTIDKIGSESMQFILAMSPAGIGGGSPPVQYVNPGDPTGNAGPLVVQNPSQYYNPSNPHYLGLNQQCVALIQAIFSPGSWNSNTNNWYGAGSGSITEDTPVGTVVATFDPNGRYINDTHGLSHVGIFMGFDNQGQMILEEQYAGSGGVVQTHYSYFPRPGSAAISNPLNYQVVLVQH